MSLAATFGIKRCTYAPTTDIHGAVEDLWTPRFFRVNTGPRMRPVVNARGDVRYIFR